MRFSHLVMLLFLSAAAFCSDYQVVIKSSGKIIHGEFLSEDAKTITVKAGNAEVSFGKARLDLERMRELNRALDAPSTVSVMRPQLPPKEVGLAIIRKLDQQIPEREETLARY